jgi:hypothetical protein
MGSLWPQLLLHQYRRRDLLRDLLEHHAESFHQMTPINRTNLLELESMAQIVVTLKKNVIEIM